LVASSPLDARPLATRQILRDTQVTMFIILSTCYPQCLMKPKTSDEKIPTRRHKDANKCPT